MREAGGGGRGAFAGNRMLFTKRWAHFRGLHANLDKAHDKTQEARISTRRTCQGLHSALDAGPAKPTAEAQGSRRSQQEGCARPFG